MGARSALLYTCSNCGTPLPLTKPGVVACPRCNADNFVTLPEPQAAPPAAPPAPFVPAPPAPVDWGPPPAPVGPISISTPKKSSAGCVVIALLGLVAAAGGAAYFLIHRGEKAEEIVSWAGGGKLCLADVDGDGNEDLVGQAGFPDMHLVGIEARSGKIVWRQKLETSESPQLYCGGGGILSSGAFDMVSIQGIDPKTGKKKWTVSLSDKLDKIAFGKGCAVLETIDKKRKAIDMSSGAAADCKDASPPSPIYSGPAPVRAGDLEVSLVSKGEGTPKLGVRATKAGKTVWEADLAALGFDGASLVSTEHGIVVGGIDRGSKEMVLTLLDRASGSALKSKREKVHDSSSVTLGGNDRAVFAATFGQIRAYDPKSLDQLWWGGTFWQDH